MPKPLPTLEKIIENTAFKQYPRASALLETLKWLEQGAPHQFDGLPGKFEFDMNQFIYHNDEVSSTRRADPKCGTACCIAGAIRMYERGGKTYKGGEPEKGIDDHFDTEGDLELGKLFYARGSDMYLSDITPKGAAKTIRRYIKTGKVKWKEDEQ